MSVTLGTIGSPEFINLQPNEINPLMSDCDIKILYLGENRNGTYIDKDTATRMSKTLRGAPIVGYYKEEKEDFRDHGESVTFEGGEIIFEKKTRPYGFVSPDAQVWFQDFEEQNGFGETIARTYLMTKGFLWTNLYEEAKLPAEEGRPQSMELDSESIEGDWERNSQGVEFFIINDAIFQSLCILGEDVEPCFEGASVNPSNSYSLDKEFQTTLYSMMKDLKNVIEGGKEREMAKDVQAKEEEELQKTAEEIAEVEVETENENATTETETAVEETENVEEIAEAETPAEEAAPAADSFTNEDDDDEEENYQARYTALEEQYNELNTKYQSLEGKYQSINEELNKYQKKEKLNVIDKFSMLSEDSKKDVVDNIDKYTVEEIESKLSVVFAREQMSKVTEKEEDKPVITTYNVNNSDENIPGWIKRVQEHKNNNK